MGEHSWREFVPPLSLYPGPGQDVEESWSMEVYTRASPTNAYGTVDFQDTATRVCRAKVCKSNCKSANRPVCLVYIEKFCTYNSIFLYK